MGLPYHNSRGAEARDGTAPSGWLEPNGAHTLSENRKILAHQPDISGDLGSTLRESLCPAASPSLIGRGCDTYFILVQEIDVVNFARYFHRFHAGFFLWFGYERKPKLIGQLLV